MKNKKFFYKTIDLDGNEKVHSITSKEILDMYWYDWCYMKHMDKKEDEISEENCITDFIDILKAVDENSMDKMTPRKISFKNLNEKIEKFLNELFDGREKRKELKMFTGTTKDSKGYIISKNTQYEREQILEKINHIRHYYFLPKINIEDVEKIDCLCTGHVDYFDKMKSYIYELIVKGNYEETE